MSGITVKIGADISGFEKGQRDAVSSARRGAQEMASAYVMSGAVARATVQSAAINMAAVQVASGNVAATMSGALKTSAIDGFSKIGEGASTGIAHIETLDQKLAALPGPVAKVVEGFAAFQAVTTVWRAFNEALEDTEVRIARLNAISAAAKQLGTGPTFLTSLIAQAKALHLETETLTGMLERAREASRVKIGEGKDAVNESAIQARLRQNVLAGNLSQADVAPYNAARDQEGQIRAILDLLEKLKASNRDLAANDLGRTFFGADFEAKTRQGIDLVGAFRAALDGAKAAGSGLAPTPDELARAKEFADREEAIAATIRDAIAPAVHDFNDLSDAGKRTWLEWEEHVAGWVKWLGEGYLKIRDVAAQVRQMAADWGLIGQPPAATGQNDGDPLVIRVKPKPKAPDRSNPLPSLSSARAPRDAQDPDSVANVIRQLEKARDLAEAELKTVGLSNVEKERAVSLAKAEAAARADVEKGVRDSAALTAEETTRILAAADATATFKDRQKDLEQQLRANADAARYFGDALANSIGDAVLEGKNLADILTSLEKQLARGVLNAVFTGQGPLASLLGLAPTASAGPNAVGGLAGLFSSAFGSSSANSPLPGAQGPSLPGAGASLFSSFASIFAADGGHVSGPGSSTSDSIPAMLSNGEFVVNAAATARNRVFLEAMNSGTILHRAEGGPIGRADMNLSMPAAALARQDSRAAQSSGGSAAPNIGVTINEAPGGDKVGNVETKQRPDGSLELIADMVERRIAGNVAKNRGALNRVTGSGFLRGLGRG